MSITNVIQTGYTHFDRVIEHITLKPILYVCCMMSNVSHFLVLANAILVNAIAQMVDYNKMKLSCFRKL